MWAAFRRRSRRRRARRTLRSISVCETARCGNGATPPGSKPVARTTSSGVATRTSAAPSARRDRALVGAAVAGDEREDVRAVADEHERLDDLGELAADRLARRRARSVSRRRTPRSARRRPPRAGRPRRARRARATRIAQPITYASSMPSQQLSRRARRRRRVDRQRHQRLPALAVARDGHVRDVDAGLAEERPDAADHARHVVVAAGAPCAARAPSRARSRARRRASGGRRCRSSCRRRATPSAVTATRFVKSRDARRFSSTTSMPRSAATTGALT